MLKGISTFKKNKFGEQFGPNGIGDPMTPTLYIKNKIALGDMKK